MNATLETSGTPSGFVSQLKNIYPTQATMKRVQDLFAGAAVGAVIVSVALGNTPQISGPSMFTVEAFSSAAYSLVPNVLKESKFIQYSIACVLSYFAVKLMCSILNKINDVVDRVIVNPINARVIEPSVNFVKNYVVNPITRIAGFLHKRVDDSVDSLPRPHTADAERKAAFIAQKVAVSAKEGEEAVQRKADEESKRQILSTSRFCAGIDISQKFRECGSHG